MALEQRWCCQYDRDTSSARGSARVLGLAGSALGAALTLWVHTWAHLLLLSSSQGSSSPEKVLCPALKALLVPLQNPTPFSLWEMGKVRFLYASGF